MRGPWLLARVRRYSLSASAGGFALRVSDHVRWRLWTSCVVESALSLVGHPCCGRGVVRIRGVDVVAHRLLNTALRFDRDIEIIGLPLTLDQARALDASFVDDWVSLDDE
jgi:hypothetical protein